MYKGTTPTFTLTLPEEVDLSVASKVYVTFSAQNGKIIEKSGDSLVINSNVCNVFLTQRETLSFPQGAVLLQINWTYTEGSVTKRACSEIAKVYIKGNLHEAVIE